MAARQAAGVLEDFFGDALTGEDGLPEGIEFLEMARCGYVPRLL